LQAGRLDKLAENPQNKSKDPPLIDSDDEDIHLPSHLPATLPDPIVNAMWSLLLHQHVLSAECQDANVLPAVTNKTHRGVVQPADKVIEK